MWVKVSFPLLFIHLVYIVFMTNLAFLKHFQSKTNWLLLQIPVGKPMGQVSKHGCLQGRSQWGGRRGRLPPRTPKIGKESKNREGGKGGKERKKRERKRKEKREGRRERKRKGKGKGKGKEKEKKERKGKEKRRKGKREEKGERKRGKKGNEFCVKVITKLREFSIKIPKSSSFWGGTSPLRHPPVRASAQLALTRHREAHQLSPPGQAGLATPLGACTGVVSRHLNNHILLRGYCTPGPYFWRLCAFAQKIKQLRTKFLIMDLNRNVPRNSKITVLLQ